MDLFEEATNSAPPDCEKETLGAFAVPDLANKAASDHYVRLATAAMKGAFERQEFKMQVRRDLDDLESEGNLFEKCTEIEETGERGRRGICAVWVEKVEVGGPRN